MATEDGRTPSITDYVKNSTNCIVGEHIKTEQISEGLCEFEFKVKEDIYGVTEFETIKVKYLSFNSDWLCGDNTFKQGHEYLMFLNKADNIFTEPDEYELRRTILCDLDDIQNSTWSEGHLYITEGADRNDLIKYIENILKSTEPAEIEYTEYFTDEDAKTVIKNCDLVLKVHTAEIDPEVIPEAYTGYLCYIKENYKGELYEADDASIIIRTLKNALELDKDYIIALSKNIYDDSYDQASPICIFDGDDEVIEKQVKEWINETE